MGRREAPDRMDGDGRRMPGRKARHIGPCSRPATLLKLDGRTREAALMRRIRDDMVEHLGGEAHVSAVQRLVVDRLAITTLRLSLYDRKLIEGSLTDHDGRIYGALHNSFRLLVKELGMKAQVASPTLAEVFGGAAV